MVTSAARPLLESHAPTEPKTLLGQWIQDAKDADLPLPTVASLATASLPSGRVASRMVNVTELNSKGELVLYSDFAHSRKGRDVHMNPRVALTFWWQPLNRSVRVEGEISLFTREESRPYFRSRSKLFQASVLIGEQSVPVEGSHEALVDKLNTHLDSSDELDVPDFWSGARIVPDWIEFWQGNDNRISDRLAYTREEDTGKWRLDRLSP